MTTPKVETVYRQGARWYVDPTTNESVPGVTSVNQSAKPYLMPWYAKLASEFAVSNIDSVADLAKVDPKAAVDLCKMAPKRYTNEAANRGTLVHSLCEDISNGLDPEVPEAVAGYVAGFREFLAEYEPVYVEREATVWNEDPAYAGTFDAIVRLPNHGDGLLLIDYKATSGVYEDVGMQLAAYVNAPEIIREDGTREPMPKVDGAAVVWLTPRGYALHPFDLEAGDCWGEFKRRHAQFTWSKGPAKKIVKSPVNTNPAKKVRK